MTIITDQYNRIDAKLFTSHNLMAKKRKMYLYKRSGSLESKDTAAADNDSLQSAAVAATTSQQSQTLSSSSPTTTTITTFPSYLLSNTSCLRVPFGSESMEVLQQQQQHNRHHRQHMSENGELRPKALRIFGKSPPTPLNTNMSNQHQTPLENQSPSCSCTNNCHSRSSSCCCDSSRLTGPTETQETLGRQQPRFPSMNSYYLLNETDDTHIGKESNEAQKQHCRLNSNACNSCYFSCATTIHKKSSPSSNFCSCISPNYLTATTERTAANRGIELDSRFPRNVEEILCSSRCSSSPSYTGHVCFSESTHSSRTSLMSWPDYRRRLLYLSKHMHRICMILKLLLALMPITLQPPKCPHSDKSNSNRAKRHIEQQHQRHPQNGQQPQMAHFNGTLYYRRRQQHQQATSCLRGRQPTRQLHTHLLPNVSNLNTLLMGLSLLSLCFVAPSQATATVLETSLEASISSFTPSTENSLTPQSYSSYPSSGHVRLHRNETVCKSLDIRNSPQQMSLLANCTVIEGFLLISLINARSFEDFNETYPLLTEVTDFVIVYQVYYLRSLGQLFPNLSIIRGRRLFESYALLVTTNPHLEELSLPRLTTIGGGGVRIEKNVMLCFVKTVDWTQIVKSNISDIYVDNNRDPVECPACPGDQWGDVESPKNKDEREFKCAEHHGHRNCWNSKTCQKFCPEKCRHNCVNETTCCHESCLSGCSGENVNECITCGNYSINHMHCTDKCPENLFVFLNRRCLTAEECLSIGTIFENNKEVTIVPFNGNCTSTCPKGYTMEKGTCVPCDGECIRKCGGSLIDGAIRAKEYHGCHYVEGGLTIMINRASQINAELEYALSTIETISGYLKIQGTYGMFNLQFFKNLKTIKGEQLIENKYALYVLENTDLENLWNPNQTVRIENGTVYFHFNPKLCLSEIHALLPMMKNQTRFDKNEVAEDSNGSKGSCNTSLLDVMVYGIRSMIALVNITNPIIYEDDRTFIGYQYLYMEDPYGNATKYGFRPCDDGWIVSEPSKESKYFFSNLKPFTQYAFYVKTMTISSERRNAQSHIHHFTTKSAQPSIVYKPHGYANSSSEIVMSWQPPLNPNGKLISYRIRAAYDDRAHQVEFRNYCKDPLKVGSTKIDKLAPPTSIIAEKPSQPQDCKCSKAQGTIFTDEVVDANIQMSIHVENTLMNFVYVKKQPIKGKKNKIGKVSNNSFDELSMGNSSSFGEYGNETIDADMMSIRSRRDVVPTEPYDSFMLRHIRQAPVYTEGNASTNYNETRMDPTGQYYEIFSTSVNATTYSFVFNKLKHFSWYVLDIEACRELEQDNNDSACSTQMKIYVRTLKLENVDKVEHLRAELVPTNSSRRNIRVFWEQPQKPNGAVVSYTILYELQAHDEFEERKCVTEVDYVAFEYGRVGYPINNLQSGNYSIKIQTNTLAGLGHISDTYFILIPPSTLDPGTIAGITVGSILLILLIGLVIYLLFRKRILAPPSDLKIFPSANPHYISLQYIPDEWEVARERVIQLSSLGQGSFGMVYEGILKSSDDDAPCAIKTVNENATDRERMNFLNEACVMKQFDTYHVVRLLGVCSRGQPALVIMELMKNGDLKSYLRAHRPDERDEIAAMHLMNRGGMSSQPPPLSRIYQMAIEIADGMAYLAAKKFVHRDLAARNCMVAADLTVKIGDFGMTRDIYENDYYRKGTKGLLPVRWMPPESLRDGVYSTSSDVFSYGVVLWEMATLASQPYQGLSNDQVLRYVIDGGVMERPENCPDKLYSLMQKCWHHRPSARPTFIEIIRYLFDLADPHFREVSFYNSEDGQHILSKEVADRNQRSGDVFDDPENDTEDVTTPLRLEEYSNYKLNMDNNSSMGQRGDSSMVMDDDAAHSPYSMGSPMVVSSTPDEQSRGSYNTSRILHPHSHLLNSAPSTSAGLRKLGTSSTSDQLTHPHTHPHHRNLYQPTRFSQQQQSRQNHSEDAYVQPDFEQAYEGNKRDSDEQGYEIYDPSPNYREHVASNVGGDDDEDDFGILSTAGQNLLVRPKGRQKQPTIMPLSASMPDDVIGQQTASSLHPSTASAASSNTSSKAGTGKYPSLRAVADSARYRMMNMRIFHKRSGSNASHKSTSSNPNSSTGGGGSINNLARSGRGKSMSGQNLGTIESGGSGSAGSYSANPRFLSTSSGTSTSDNPNYKRLDDSVGDNSVIGSEVNKIRPRLQSASAFMMGSSQPNYKMLDESLNTTGASVHTGENPNYEIMQPGGAHSLSNEATSSYVMMNEPSQKKMSEMSAMNISNDEANYQLMCPLLPTTNTTATTIPLTATTTIPTATVLAPTDAAEPLTPRPVVGERINTTFSSSSSTTSTSSSHENDDLHAMKDIKTDSIPLSSRSSTNDHKTKKDRSRSESSSSGKSAKNTASSSSTIPTLTTASQQQIAKAAETGAAAPSSTFSLKEQWFKEQQQQQQQQTQQPPPNGFVGREA